MSDQLGLGQIGVRLLDILDDALKRRAEPGRVLALGKASADAEAYRIEAVARAEGKAAEVAKDADQALVQRAFERVRDHAVRKQVNVEAIAVGAARIVDEESEELDPAGLEADWIWAFQEYAQNVGAPELQRLWSQILARKASARKSGLSLMTLDSLRLMEPHQAADFEYAVKLIAALGSVLAPLKPWREGVRDDEPLFALEELGFLSSTTPSFPIPMRGFLLSLDGAAEEAPRPALAFRQYELTYRGRELADVVVPELAACGYAFTSKSFRYEDDPALRLLDAEAQASVIRHWAEYVGAMGGDLLVGLMAADGNPALELTYTHRWDDRFRCERLVQPARKPLWLRLLESPDSTS